MPTRTDGAAHFPWKQAISVIVASATFTLLPAKSPSTQNNTNTHVAVKGSKIEINNNTYVQTYRTTHFHVTLPTIIIVDTPPLNGKCAAMRVRVGQSARGGRCAEAGVVGTLGWRGRRRAARQPTAPGSAASRSRSSAAAAACTRTSCRAVSARCCWRSRSSRSRASRSRLHRMSKVTSHRGPLLRGQLAASASCVAWSQSSSQPSPRPDLSRANRALPRHRRGLSRGDELVSSRGGARSCARGAYGVATAPRTTS